MSRTWGPCDALGAASCTPSHYKTGQLPPSPRAPQGTRGSGVALPGAPSPQGPCVHPLPETAVARFRGRHALLGSGRALHPAVGAPPPPCSWQLARTSTRSGPGAQPPGCLAGHLPRCTSQSYLGVQEPCSGGPLTRGSISEVQGSRRPGHRARWAPLAPPWGRPRGSMQTPRTGSGLGTGWAGISSS